MTYKEYCVILTTTKRYFVEATDVEYAADYALDEAAYEYPDLDFDVKLVETA